MSEGKTGGAGGTGESLSGGRCVGTRRSWIGHAFFFFNAFCIIYVNFFRFLSSLYMRANLEQSVSCKGRLLSKTLSSNYPHQ